jgi:sigma-B regulation protein RsbU (phosphoserine phosphatase)
VDSAQRRVLLVDDSKTSLEVIKVYLMGQNYRFDTASDGQLALECAHRNKPDIIISDLAMPEIGGIELCRRFRAIRAFQTVPFVVVTATKDVAVRREAFAAGVDGFLTKPVNGDQLRALLVALFSQ